MAACLLSESALTLTNVPNLADVVYMADVLRQLGVGVAWQMSGPDHVGGTIKLRAPKRPQSLATYDAVRKMRASFLVLGPLVARIREAMVSLPGGCAIGARPVDLHLKGLAAMGAEIELTGGYVLARAPGGLKGAEFVFPSVSVGATENLLMAASLAKGYDRAQECRARAGDRRSSAAASSPWERRFPGWAPRPSWWKACRSLGPPPMPCCPTASRPAPMPLPRPSPAARWS